MRRRVNVYTILLLLGGVAPAEVSLAQVASPIIIHPVATERVQRQSAYQTRRVFAGRVVGQQRAELGFEQAGTVARVLVDDGQKVAMGQSLAELDKRSLMIEQRRLLAQKQELSARLGQLRRDQQRYQALRQQAYISEGQLDELNTRVSTAEAQLSQLVSQLNGIALQLEKAVLRAPFPGEVANLQLEEGVVVAPGQPAMVLVQTGKSEAIFGISDQLGRDLVLGQTMAVFGDFGELEAPLTSVANNLDWRTQTRLIRVQLPADSPAVDGNTAYIQLPQTRQVSGFWLPEQALVGDVRGTWAVYALAPEDADVYRLHKHSVVAIYHYQGRVYVGAELADGTRVVSAGVHKLVPGQKVKLAAAEHSDVARAE